MVIEKRVKLNVIGITFSQVQAGAYALVLKEENGIRRIPIIIGTPEAQSIAIFLENLHPPRPLSHDLFVTILNHLQVAVKEVYIHKFEEGVFYANIVLHNGVKDISIDSRTSDAIALAVRVSAPIYITEEIMKKESTEIEVDTFMDDLEIEGEMPSPEVMEVERLQSELDKAILVEDYEKAVYIRDLMNKAK
jgi:bifunctional DNase/RNase